MPNSVNAALSRQDGLMREMSVVANNLANASTTGFKSDHAIFAEYVVATGRDAPSLSMGGLAAHTSSLAQGGLKFTGGAFDLAIQGDGFFLVETQAGPRLTRAGHFQMSRDGALVDPQGNSVLSVDGAPIILPPGGEGFSVSGEGLIYVDGEPIDLVGVFAPQGQLSRDSNTYFAAPGGYAAIEAATIVQGALEQSNVSPVLEMARMIDVHRAYEAGQALLEREDQRVSQLITALRER